jgi:septal ring factor EnvC (AmiA/AmiB activator)
LCSTAEEDLKGYHFQKGEVEKQLAVVKEQLRTNGNELSEVGATIKKLKDENLPIMKKLTQLKDMEEDMEESEPNSIAILVSILYSRFNNCGF